MFREETIRGEFTEDAAPSSYLQFLFLIYGYNSTHCPSPLIFLNFTISCNEYLVSMKITDNFPWAENDEQFSALFEALFRIVSSRKNF